MRGTGINFCITNTLSRTTLIVVYHLLREKFSYTNIRLRSFLGLSIGLSHRNRLCLIFVIIFQQGLLNLNTTET